MRISYHDVESSNIKAIAYDKGKGYVEFLSGRRFAYEMPLELFNKMKAAPSIGGFFSKHVKNTCVVAWNGWHCSASPCQEDAAFASEAATVKFYLCAKCAELPKFTGIPLKPLEKAP